MAMGKSIENQRNRLQMTREALGEKLSVSGQLVELWEKNQTVPTLEELQRMREIFGVSAEDFPKEEKEIEDPEQQPEEFYRVQFEPAELKELLRLQNLEIGKKIAVPLGAFAILAAISWTVKPAIPAFSGFLTGMFFTFLLAELSILFQNSKVFKTGIERISASIYEYRIFKDSLLVSIYRRGVKMKEMKCYFDELEKVSVEGSWLRIQYNGQQFILRANEIKENSPFSVCIIHNQKRIHAAKVAKEWAPLSLILFIGCFAAFFALPVYAAAMARFF